MMMFVWGGGDKEAGGSGVLSRAPPANKLVCSGARVDHKLPLMVPLLGVNMSERFILLANRR